MSMQNIKQTLHFAMIHQTVNKPPSRHITSKQRRTNVGATSWRRIDVGTLLFQGCVPAGQAFRTDY